MIKEAERLQGLFDTVMIGLLKQGKRSVDGDNRCVYRGPDGLKCAAGFLMPDEAFDVDLNNLTIYTVPYFKNNYNPLELQFIKRMQTIHDNHVSAHPIKSFKDYFFLKMKELGLQYGLVVKERKEYES